MGQSSTSFARLVAEAVERIPERIRIQLRNVAIVIADIPTVEQCHDCGVDPDEGMYGYYEGTPLTERDLDGEPLLPDRIILFRRTLEEDFGDDPDALRTEIAATVRHELAHHFGIDDDRLEEIGKY